VDHELSFWTHLLMTRIRSCGFACLLASFANPAFASASDVTATRDYLETASRLAQAEDTHVAASSAAVASLVRRVRKACPGAASGAPMQPSEETSAIGAELPGATLVAEAAPDRVASRDFVGTVRKLRWRSSRVTRAVRDYLNTIQAELALAELDLCSDVRAWEGWRFSGAPGGDEPICESLSCGGIQGPTGFPDGAVALRESVREPARPVDQAARRRVGRASGADVGGRGG
jgi:hypothetical protein